MLVGVTAWPHQGIVPLELWDVLVEGSTLFARRNEPTFYASLVTAVLAVRSGAAVREGGARVPASHWSLVSMVGGALEESRARDAFDAAGVALGVLSDDAFFAASHALEALGETGIRADAVVVDVGQTAIKASGPGGRIHRQRRNSADGTNDRDVFIEEIAAALADACPGRAPSFVLLGLPCEVELREGALLLGASTYPTAGEASTLVHDVLARAVCAATPVAVVNDAVLAAWALTRRSIRRAQAHLVLTIGLGVGAALIDGDLAHRGVA